MTAFRQQRRSAERAARKARALGSPAAEPRCVICALPADGPVSAVARCDCGCGSERALLPPGVPFCQHCGQAGALFGVLLLEEGAGDLLPVCLADVADFLVDGPGADLVSRRTWNRIGDRASRDLFRGGLCSCQRCLKARGPVQ